VPARRAPASVSENRASRSSATRSGSRRWRRRATSTRFSRPVRTSSTAANWPVREIDSRTRPGWSTTSCPCTLAVPASGATSVDRIRTSVVLPAPLEPRSATMLPGATSRSTPRSTRRSPNDFSMPRTRSAGSRDRSTDISVLRFLGASRVVRSGPADDDVAVAGAGVDLRGGLVLDGPLGRGQVVADAAVLGARVQVGGGPLGGADLDRPVRRGEGDAARLQALDPGARVRGLGRERAGDARDRDVPVRAVHGERAGDDADRRRAVRGLDRALAADLLDADGAGARAGVQRAAHAARRDGARGGLDVEPLDVLHTGVARGERHVDGAERALGVERPGLAAHDGAGGQLDGDVGGAGREREDVLLPRAGEGDR